MYRWILAPVAAVGMLLVADSGQARADNFALSIGNGFGRGISVYSGSRFGAFPAPYRGFVPGGRQFGYSSFRAVSPRIYSPYRGGFKYRSFPSSRFYGPSVSFRRGFVSPRVSRYGHIPRTYGSFYRY